MTARIIVRSARGLEWVAAAEVSARLPGAEAIAMSPREVSFRLPAVGPAVLVLRTVDDAFLVVGTVDEVGPAKEVPAAVAGRVARLDWAGALRQLALARRLPERPRFDVVASLAGRHNYSRFTLENAAGLALAPVLGGGYLACTAEGRQAGEPDLTVRLFVRAGAATVALRLALGNAAGNCARAGIEIALSGQDAGRLSWPAHSVGVVVTNPPWNVAVDARGLLGQSLDRFWQQLSSLLTPSGRFCVLSDARLGVPERLRRMEYQLALATQVRPGRPGSACPAGRAAEPAAPGPSGGTGQVAMSGGGRGHDHRDRF